MPDRIYLFTCRAYNIGLDKSNQDHLIKCSSATFGLPSELTLVPPRKHLGGGRCTLNLIFIFVLVVSQIVAPLHLNSNENYLLGLLRSFLFKLGQHVYVHTYDMQTWRGCVSLLVLPWHGLPTTDGLFMAVLQPATPRGRLTKTVPTSISILGNCDRIPCLLNSFTIYLI